MPWWLFVLARKGQGRNEAARFVVQDTGQNSRHLICRNVGRVGVTSAYRMVNFKADKTCRIVVDGHGWKSILTVRMSTHVTSRPIEQKGGIHVFHPTGRSRLWSQLRTYSFILFLRFT